MGFFKKKKTVKASGITEEEYRCILRALEKAYEDAHARQKPGNKVPSGFMNGIEHAIEIVTSVEPHTIEVPYDTI